MRVLSVCSGIGCETVAWKPLGWETVAFSEIDPQAVAVLRHHYPEIPVHGDFTTLKGAEFGPIDLLVGGTPCQSFSVAGLRGGLDDDRGNLALQFCRLADRARPRWIVWENVPGVLSSNEGRDFGSFLGALGELGYGYAWRTLDAQFIRVESHPRAVPQRRRRIIVVGHLGDWRPPVAVLLEPESMRRDSPPRRETGPAASALTGSGVGTCGADDNQAQSGHLVAYGRGVVGGPLETAGALTSRNQRIDFEVETFICQEHPVASEAAPPLTSNPYGDHESREGLLVSHSLRSEGFDASEDGTGRGTPLVPFDAAQAIAFSSKDHGADAIEGVSPTLRAMPHDQIHPNGGGQVAVAMQGNATRPIIGDEVAPTMDQKTGKVSVMIDNMVVRRITPLEAERLMGLPDSYSAIDWKGKPLADGPRYRLIGNGIAINKLSWIGQRIQLFEEVRRKIDDEGTKKDLA